MGRLDVSGCAKLQPWEYGDEGKFSAEVPRKVNLHRPPNNGTLDSLDYDLDLQMSVAATKTTEEVKFEAEHRWVHIDHAVESFQRSMYFLWILRLVGAKLS